eukprot:1507083-Pyramimonas_sp.AAC.1
MGGADRLREHEGRRNTITHCRFCGRASVKEGGQGVRSEAGAGTGETLDSEKSGGRGEMIGGIGSGIGRARRIQRKRTTREKKKKETLE